MGILARLRRMAAGGFQQPIPQSTVYNLGLHVPERMNLRGGVRDASVGRWDNPIVGSAAVILEKRPQVGQQGIGSQVLLEMHYPEVHIQGFGG